MSKNKQVDHRTRTWKRVREATNLELKEAQKAWRAFLAIDTKDWPQSRNYGLERDEVWMRFARARRAGYLLAANYGQAEVDRFVTEFGEPY